LADAVALVADITALTYAIALIRAPAPPAPMFDPFVEDQPFNLASRAGSQAYTYLRRFQQRRRVGGNVSTFPPFIARRWNQTI